MTIALRVLAPTAVDAPRRRLATGLTDLRGGAASPFERLSHLVRAVESAALEAVVVPFDQEGLDPLVVAGDLLRQTRHTRVVAELPGPFATPVYAAKLSVSLQRFHGARLGWRVDPSAWVDERGRLGEFLRVARAVWSSRDVDLRGEHYAVLGGGFGAPLDGQPFPAVEVVGVDDLALEVGAEHAALQVVPALDVADHVDRVRSVLGARVRLGVDLDVVTAARPEDAEAEASRAGTPPGALVGSFDDVARRLRELDSLGVDVVTVRLGRPVEQAYRLGEHVVPRLAVQEAARG